MTYDPIAEALKALEDVTPGPWWHDNNEGFGANNVWAAHPKDAIGKEIVAGVHGVSAEAEANARFIAWCREGVPALLDALEKAQASAEAAERDLRAIHHMARHVLEEVNLMGSKGDAVAKHNIAYATGQIAEWSCRYVHATRTAPQGEAGK